MADGDRNPSNRQPTASTEAGADSTAGAQRVVVVGGSSGIGLAVARQFSDRGATVTITGRDAKRLGEAAARIGPRCTPVVLDAGDGDASSEFFAREQSVDHLVLAASGGAGAGLFRELDLRGLRAGFEGKFWPQLLTLSKALPFLAKTASVTLLTAISSRSADPGTAGLAAINGALEAMVPTLAVELAPVRVNAVSPGVIDTPWWEAFDRESRDEMFAEFAARTPVGRVGQPDEVADAVLFLAYNRFVTGVVLPCDGGLYLV